MGLEKRGYMLGGSYFIDDGEDALYVEFPEGKVKYVPERTCKNVGYYIDNTRLKCSECGFNGWIRDARIGDDVVPTYCPSCGAKVVE